jgi:hypothetical protein
MCSSIPSSRTLQGTEQLNQAEVNIDPAGLPIVSPYLRRRVRGEYNSRE